MISRFPMLVDQRRIREGRPKPYTLDEIAKITGLGLNTVRRWYNSENLKSTKLNTLNTLAKFAGCSIAELSIDPDEAMADAV